MLTRSLSPSAVAPLLVALFALNGATVSTLYWAQAVAPSVAHDLGSSPWVGFLPSAALGGYALGVALLAGIARDLTTANGLGLHALLLGVGLSAAAIAPSGAPIAIACLVVGLGCALTQRALACASSAVGALQRGPVIGGVIASGLSGIVAARALVPTISARLGWRTMFMLDAALICTLGLLAAIAMLRVDRSGWSGDRVPMPSAWRLWRGEPVVRRAALQQAVVFAAFNAGWAVFPRMLSSAGLPTAIATGSVAALGAVAALGSGWLCRRAPPGRVALMGFGSVLLAVTGAAGFGTDPAAAIGLMALLDSGTQVALVANQAQAQACATSAAMRGRIAAIVTTIGFSAGAIGAAVGNSAW